MDVIKTLRPGKNDTKCYVELYGDNLVAIRYRLNAERQISYTAVELSPESGNSISTLKIGGGL